jgi:gluconolactonase
MKKSAAFVLAAAWLATSCQQKTASTGEAAPAAAASPAAALPVTAAELLGANATWGNTEGPAVDSKNNLYFTSRGTYKGIVKWNEKEGFSEYLAVAVSQGPGGLYIDDKDNIFVTATGEQQILKVSPDKKVAVVAEKFDAMPKDSKGPNDLVVHPNGTIYFTEPNGYDGKSPKGTVYRIDPAGKASVFSQEVTGPNGIMLSLDKKTLYVAHNVAENTSHVVKWALKEDGSAGPMELLTKVEPCQADGMDINQNGDLWLTCYFHGHAYRISGDGKLQEKVTTAQTALTNAIFGRGEMRNWLYFTSSDMARVTGYIYRTRTAVGGAR